MEALITITSQPLEYVRISEGARFVSTDRLEIEQKQLLARRMALGMRYGAAHRGTISMQERSDISRAFSTAGSAAQPAPSKSRAESQPAPSNGQSHGKREFMARYQTELGAFETKVYRKGLTFVPPLVMTIITQYPEIHFEYNGGFQYVPPREEPSGSLLDLVG